MTPNTPSMMNALRQIARALSVAENLDTTLDLIVRQTTELMGVDSCTIYLLDKDSDLLRLRATTGLDHQALGRATLRMGEGMTGRAAATGTAIYSENAQRNPHFKAVAGTRESIFQSLLAVPLIVENKSIGALNMQTILPRAFTSIEVETVALIGDLAAGALYKAQLSDDQRRQLAELKALAQVSEIVTSPRYLDDMLDIVTDMAAQTMNAAVCSIFLIDESGRYLELRSAKRQTSTYKHRPPLPIGQGTIGHVATSGEPIYIWDVRTDPRYVGQALAREEGLVSLVAEPLSVRDRVIGVLTCYTDQPRHFSPQQRALFATLANQTALAIENTRLMTNAAVVKEMHHRIKNNLQTVAMLMRLQLSEADKLNTREVLEISIDRIQSIATVHEILSERGFHLVDVHDVLVRITREVITDPEQDIIIEVHGEALSLPSRAATSIALVVNELIHNAIEHGFAGRQHGHVRVTIGHVREEIMITVIDNGHGIPDFAHHNLGLELVETLVGEDLQGTVAFRNTAPGTEVVIRMPREIEDHFQ